MVTNTKLTLQTSRRARELSDAVETTILVKDDDELITAMATTTKKYDTMTYTKPGYGHGTQAQWAFGTLLAFMIKQIPDAKAAELQGSLEQLKHPSDFLGVVHSCRIVECYDKEQGHEFTIGTGPTGQSAFKIFMEYFESRENYHVKVGVAPKSSLERQAASELSKLQGLMKKGK